MRPQPEGRGEQRSWRQKQKGMTASMRPQPEGRGEHGARLFICLGCEGFNAATARRPWRTADSLRKIKREILLQCGHSPKAVENPSLSVAARRSRIASMRPQPEGRGERGSSASLNCQCVASMRPQPEGRGEQPVDPAPFFATCLGFNAATARRPWRTETAHEQLASLLELQCGHSPKAVENIKQVGSNGLHWPLQCGHSPKAVENLDYIEYPRQVCVLQCGHSPKAVENVDRQGHCDRRWHASMRPQPEGCGERGIHPVRNFTNAGLQCGHSPKAVENAKQSGSTRKIQAELQCGHSPKAVENASHCCRARGPADASMRPQPEGRGELASA